MHNLLKHQLKKMGVNEDLPPDIYSWRMLLARISSSYEQADRDKYLLEHSMDVSSAEMQQLYDELRDATEALLYEEKERAHITLQSIDDAVIVTAPGADPLSLDSMVGNLSLRVMMETNFGGLDHPTSSSITFLQHVPFPASRFESLQGFRLVCGAHRSRQDGSR